MCSSPNVKGIVYMLVMLFGMSSWLGVNSVWMVLPLLVKELPEKWYLPSFLAVIVQIASVGPLAFAIFDKVLKVNMRHEVLIYFLLALGAVSQLLLGIFWKYQGDINGKPQSVALFILFFFLSLVDCTSNVVFLPFMFSFKSQYTTAYFIGMGFSALVPSIFALIQGAGLNECVLSNLTINGTESNVSDFKSTDIDPNFTVHIFNVFMFIAMVVSFCAFWCLNNLEICRSEKNALLVQPNDRIAESAPSGEETKIYPKTEPETVVDAKPGAVMAFGRYVVLLILTAFVCSLMNGSLPAIQVFSCAPYGQMTYHLAVIFSNLANPIACFIPFFLHQSSHTILYLLTALEALFAAYCFAMAALSPYPVLVDEVAGMAIIIIAWILAIGMAAYLRTLMGDWLRTCNRPHSLFWCGAATQIGSLLGAVIMFPLVNVLNMFVPAKTCR